MTPLLLDTRALLWWLADDPTLAPDARHAIADPEIDVLVSAASAWEISIKRTAGKLEAPDDLERQLTDHRFGVLPITIQHALHVGSLPPHHTDPFDRMLVAQAQVEGLRLVTRDERIRRYAVATLEA